MEPKFQVERTTLKGTFGWLLGTKSTKRKRVFIPQERVHFITFLRPPDKMNQEDQYNQLWQYKSTIKIRHQIFKKSDILKATKSTFKKSHYM